MVERVEADRIRSGRTRLIAYGGLALCVLLVLFGPQVAELGLSVLGCPLGYGLPGAACGGFLAGPASALASWVRVAPPVETLFLLLQQLWPLLLIWGAGVLLSMRADRAAVDQPPLRQLDSEAAQNAEGPGSTRLSEGEAQAQWVQPRQREQALEEEARRRSLTEQLFAEARFLGIAAVSCWVLIFGLFAFCVAFGVPLLGGVSADSVLNAFGCLQPAQAAMDPLTNACGLLQERLAPYRKPFFGALLSPVWLFTQFSDLLLLWLGSILLVAVLPIFRLGVRRVLRTHPATAFALFAVSAMSTYALASLWLLGAPEWASAQRSTNGVAPAVAALEVIFFFALVLVLLVLVVLVLGLIYIFVRVSQRHARAGSNPQRSQEG